MKHVLNRPGDFWWTERVVVGFPYAKYAYS